MAVKTQSEGFSMVAMRAMGICEVLTHDHHFTQEGFQILFP